jgi:hypothetical protein
MAAGLAHFLVIKNCRLHDVLVLTLQNGEPLNETAARGVRKTSNPNLQETTFLEKCPRTGNYKLLLLLLLLISSSSKQLLI